MPLNCVFKNGLNGKFYVMYNLQFKNILSFYINSVYIKLPQLIHFKYLKCNNFKNKGFHILLKFLSFFQTLQIYLPIFLLPAT